MTIGDVAELFSKRRSLNSYYWKVAWESGELRGSGLYSYSVMK
jgi:hypothetical protein